MKFLLSLLTLGLIIVAAIALTNHPYKKYLPAGLDQQINATVDQQKQQAQDYINVKKDEIKEDIKVKAESEIEKTKTKLLSRLKMKFWEGIDQGRAFFVNLFK